MKQHEHWSLQIQIWILFAAAGFTLAHAILS